MTNKIKNENLVALKEDIKATVRFDAEINYKFDKEVNDILKRDGYHTQIPIVTPKDATRVADAICDAIINSDLSMYSKDYMMSAILTFIYSAANAERYRSQDFEKRLEDINWAVDHYKMEEDNKSEIFPTQGTTESHKSIEVE